MIARRAEGFVGIVALALLYISGSASASSPAMTPLPNHPGNIFLQGEEVSVALPPGTEPKWQAIDYEQKVVASGTSADGRANLGKLRVGYYEVRRDGSKEKVAVGVLAPLRAPTPDNSRVATDAAMSWFYKDDATKQQASSLCKLAGIKWVRDRMSWPEMQKQPGGPIIDNRSDSSVRIERDAGLNVLQVNHAAPRWQKDQPSRFPHDLRDAYDFYKKIAQRWKGQVVAFEPWNEADIDPFGAHTGSEMASMQKASYLGLKAGNPDVIACLNVFAKDRTTTLDDFGDNQAWPYYDTYNIHHYAGVERYPAIYANHRRVSAGRPIWVTECNITVKWTGDPNLHEPTDADLHVQARRVARVLTSTIFQGAEEAFYFILGDYVEGQTQYGALHKDLTPRPAYLALAVAGRLLAGAQPLGEWNPTTAARAYAFTTFPDGQKRDVLVVWSHESAFHVDDNLPIESAFDCLGRKIPGKKLSDLRFDADPTFVVLPAGSVAKLDLKAPPKEPEFRKGDASPVVLQALIPHDRELLEKSAYTISKDNPGAISIYAYNFSNKPIHGTLTVAAPEGWQAKMPTTLDLKPGDRKELPLDVTPEGSELKTLKVTGDFGPAGRAVLSFRLIPND